jgi:uncharacterized SAM-binding protein YcdF (DUF218 family)
MRRFIAAALLVLLGVWLVSFVAVMRASRRDQAAPASAIVVLGAAQYNGRPSPVLRERLNHAATLWNRGLAPRVVVTGGVGEGDTVSEAVVAQRYLTQVRGIPDSALVVVAEGSTSAASLRAVAQRLGAGTTVILVSDGFHLFRLGLIARGLHLRTWGSPAPDSPIRASRRREALYLLGESLKVPIVFVLTRFS